MFEEYVETTATLEKYRHAPLAEDRQRFLVHLRESGHSYIRVQHINVLLLAIARSIDWDDHRMVSRAELSVAADKWVARRTRPGTRPRSTQVARTDFISVGSEWLRFLGRLEEIPAPAPFADQLDAFLRHLRDERGLAGQTLTCRRRALALFFGWLSERGVSIATVGPKEITEYFSAHRVRPWKRATVSFHVYTLRSFFRYAASHSWCAEGIAATIDKPRMYSHQGLPEGPTWTDVQRLIASVSGDHPTQARSRAIILLLAIYGFRIGEVCRLRLDDIDWQAERIYLRRPKQRRTQEYPLIVAAGEAILRYIREVRPRSSHREVFLTLKQPYHPPCAAGLGTIIIRHIKNLGVRLPHYGPHILRHACATHLLAAGFSLKEIGDHLGHKSPAATQIYAKVDLSSLRQAAAEMSDLSQYAAQCQREATPFFPKGSLAALREVARLHLGGLQ
jgi:integrase/recombinase XerD